MTKITGVEVDLLHLPLPRPMLSGSSGGAGGKPLTHMWVPVVTVRTADGPDGVGWGWSLLSGGQAIAQMLRDDVTPLLIGENALDHERLWALMYRRLQSVGRRGVANQAIAAIDLALWDIKGRLAGLPVHKLLGGRREMAPVYGSDSGWLYMDVADMIAGFEQYLDDGMIGVKMKVGHEDPTVDITRVREVRQALGDDVWLAVDANQCWDYPTALRVGRDLEALGAVWFEEPMSCEDMRGHARLAAELDLAIAAGESMGSRHEFAAWLAADALDVAQPDVIRAGGITETLRITTLAETAGRPVALHHMMEVSVHIACGVLDKGPIEYMPWLDALFGGYSQIDGGFILAPDAPGLGVELEPELVERYRAD